MFGWEGNICTNPNIGFHSQARHWMLKWHYSLYLGAQVLLEKCTLSRDTVCGCKEGLMCGDDQCSFCITACVKGNGPSEDSKWTAHAAQGQFIGDSQTPACLCRFLQNVSQRNLLWPSATEVQTVEHQVRVRLYKTRNFSVQPSHKSSLPGRCPNPDQVIVARGDAFSDIKCEDATASADYGRMGFHLLSLYECFRWKAANQIFRFCHIAQSILWSGPCCPAWSSSSSSSSSSVWV